MAKRRRPAQQRSKKNRQHDESSAAKVEPPVRPRPAVSLRTLLPVGLIAIVAVGALTVPRYVSDAYLDDAIIAMRSHRFLVADQQLAHAGNWHRQSGEIALLRGRIAWMESDSQAAGDWIDTAEEQGLDPRRSTQERTLIAVREGLAAIHEEKIPSMLRQFPEDGPAILEAFTLGYLGSGNADAAAGVIQLWLDADAEDPRAHYWRGKLLQAYGETTEATPHLRSALELAPDMTVAGLDLADILSAQYFYPEALQHYQSLIDQTDKAEVGLATCQLKTGDLAGGESRLSAWITKHPDDTSARLTLAEHFHEQGRPDDVLKTLAPLLERDAEDVDMYYLAATACQRTGDERQSAAYFERFSELSQLNETTKVLIQRYDTQPNFAAAHEIAKNLLRCHWEDAGGWILKCLSFQPRNVELYEMMADYLSRAGRPLHAENYQRRAETLRAELNSS